MLSKKLLVGITGLAMVASLAACAPDTEGNASARQGNGEQNLTFVNYGGTSMTAATKGWLEPFSKEKGVNFKTDSPSDPAKVKTMVEAGRTTWDIVDLDAASGGSGCGVLYEKRGPEVDMSAVDPKYITDECGVPVMLAPIGLVYNKKLYGDKPPTKITDFMDVKNFPGRRAIFNYAVGGFEPLLVADGVAPDKMYPVDYNRAENVIKKLGSDLTLQGTLAQQNQMLESGDFGTCLCYLGRAALASANGADIGVVWDSAYFVWDAVYAVKGSRSPEAQQSFLSYVATPKAQAAFTKYQPYAPTTPSSNLDEVSDIYKSFLPAGHEDEIGTPAVYDARWWTENNDEAMATWTRITAG